MKSFFKYFFIYNSFIKRCNQIINIEGEPNNTINTGLNNLFMRFIWKCILGFKSGLAWKI